MVIVLLESRENMITSKIPDFYRFFPKSCRANIYDKTPYEKIKTYAQPPILTKGWLLLCHAKSRIVIKLASNTSEDNVVIFQCYSRREQHDLEETLVSLEIKYSLIDNFQITESDKVNYIMEQLSIDKTSALFLCRRHHGYLPDILGSIKVLSTLDYVDKNVIRAYTRETNKYKIFDVFNYLIGVSNAITYKNAVQVVYQYRFAFDHLKSYLVESCQNYLVVFQAIDDGVLSITNYRNFHKDTSNRTIAAMSEIQLGMIVENYEIVSVDLLYMLLQLLKSLKKNDVGGLITILSLRRNM